MSIQPIEAIGGLLPPIAPLAPVATEPTTAVGPGAGTSFAAALTGGLEEVQRLQSVSNDLAVKAVTGELRDVHDYTIAASRAAVATELTVAIRNKAVEAFTEIMRMPL